MSNSDYKQAFHKDGSLRDIYILNITIEHWEKFFGIIQSSGYRLYYSRDGSAIQLPSTAADILGDRSCTHSLVIDLGGVKACCHFFAEDEIELDIDPREVNSINAQEKVLKFMALLGAELNRDVILTEENQRQRAWFRYSANDDIIRCEGPA